MKKTNIIVYVQEPDNLSACLWSIRTFTTKNTYDISIVTEKPIDNVDNIDAKVYMANCHAVRAINEAIHNSNGEHIVFCMMMLLLPPIGWTECPRY